MDETPDWTQELPAAITVTGADGTILEMNAASARTFASDGGLALVGQSVFECHPEPARSKTPTAPTPPFKSHIRTTYRWISTIPSLSTCSGTPARGIE